MILLKFEKKSSIKQVLDVLDFSRNLILNANSTSKEFDLIIQSIKDVVPYKNIFPYLMVRPNEVDVILGNAIWVLEDVVKKEKIDAKTKQMYINSIGLMKEVKQIVLDKQNQDKPKRDKGRIFFPELEKFYKSNLNKLFVFSTNYEETVGLITPKKDDIWKLISYIEANPMENIEEAEEDTLIIEDIVGTKFALPVSEFNQLAFLKDEKDKICEA